jgi:hypothetical protein
MAFKWTGNTISDGIQRIRKRSKQAFADAMHDEFVEVEFPETQRRVPVDTGDLLSTGRVSEPDIQGSKISVRILYGGESSRGTEVNYAVYVHEDLEANHPHGGQAKFVSSVLNEARPYMAERLASRMRFEKWAK